MKLERPGVPLRGVFVKISNFRDLNVASIFVVL